MQDPDFDVKPYKSQCDLNGEHPPFWRRWWRKLVPRMFRMTFFWILVFEGVCVAWWFLLDGPWSKFRLEWIDRTVSFLDYQVVAVGFLVVVDWGLGTSRYRDGGKGFLGILKAIMDYAGIFDSTINAQFDDPEFASKNYDRAHIGKALRLMKAVVRAIPYVVWILFRDFWLPEPKRLANMRKALRCTIPPDMLQQKGIVVKSRTPRRTTLKETLEDHLLDSGAERVPDLLINIVREQILVFEQQHVFTPVDAKTPIEFLNEITQRINDVGASMRVVYPRGGSHFISVVVFIYLFFVPVVLWTTTIWYTLILNAAIVFFFEGLLEIGRQIREPFETYGRNPYSDLPIRKWTDDTASFDDSLFEEIIARYDCIVTQGISGLTVQCDTSKLPDNTPTHKYPPQRPPGRTARDILAQNDPLPRVRTEMERLKSLRLV